VRTLVNDEWFLPIMGTAIASSKVMRILCMILPMPKYSNKQDALIK
jgi:hypothetical protein